MDLEQLITETRAELARIAGESKRRTDEIMTALNRSHYPIELVSVEIAGAGSVAPGETLLYNKPVEHRIEWKVAADEPLTQPYWLERPKEGELYSVTQEKRGQPDVDPVLTAHFTLRAGGQRLEIDRPVIYRWVDNVRGELTRPLVVEPARGADVVVGGGR